MKTLGWINVILCVINVAVAALTGHEVAGWICALCGWLSATSGVYDDV